ncbi:hypothetical protein APV28_4859 [Comamonas testosteroni]|nr:hypothetical protein APV28_4859 [Comamonas testosteroni]
MGVLPAPHCAQEAAALYGGAQNRHKAAASFCMRPCISSEIPIRSGSG